LSDTIFGETPPENVVIPEVVTPSLPPEVSELVGEGKKYKSAEEALKALPHAQKHISTIEEENRKLKEELSSRRAAEEILAEIKSGITPNETPSGNAIDANAVASIVAQTLDQRELNTQIQNNTQKVANAFSEKYGDKAEEVYNKLAQESGLSIPALNKLAAQSPSVVFKLAGLTGSNQVLGKPSSTVNTEALKNNQQPTELSAKVPKGATSKQVAQAWRNAGEIVKNKLS